MLPPGGRYLYGRVISTQAKIGPMAECILIYVYKAMSAEKNHVPELQPNRLLVPPMLTNRLPWSRGYFEFLRRDELRQEDQLAQHCFYDSIFNQYLDESNNVLPGPVEPVGVHGLHSFRTIDDEISKALGIPLAAD